MKNLHFLLSLLFCPLCLGSLLAQRATHNASARLFEDAGGCAARVVFLAASCVKRDRGINPAAVRLIKYVGSKHRALEQHFWICPTI
jgi:hypothetical protein